MPGMDSRKTRLDSKAAATVERITRDLLEQLRLQTEAALALLEHAAPEQRDAFLAQLAETRGRLVRLRARVLGPIGPALVRKRSCRTPAR